MADDDTPQETPRGVRHAVGSSGRTPADSIAWHLSELARDLEAEPDMAALLQRITDATVIEIDAAEHAGISLVEQRQVTTQAATSDLVRAVDDRQLRLQEGPCLSALREQITVRLDDSRHEDRWPRFAAAAAELGVQSMLSVQLFVEGDNLGALNVYAPTAHAFDDDDEATAIMLAAHAALAMKDRRAQTNLRIAVESRDIIGQAKGILMERYKIDSGAAFDLLVHASQRTQRKLRDVAEELATTGGLTTDRPARSNAAADK